MHTVIMNSMVETHASQALSPGSINCRYKVWNVWTLEDVCINPHRPVYSSAAVLLTEKI